jgi:hypothetical protein
MFQNTEKQAGGAITVRLRWTSSTMAPKLKGHPCKVVLFWRNLVDSQSLGLEDIF